MNNSNPTPPSIWKKSWTGRRATLFFLALIALAGFLVGLPIATLLAIPNETFPQTAGKVLLTILGCMAAVLLVRWLFHLRNLLRFLFVLFCAFTVIALFYAEENWRGKRAWEKFKQEWEARGVHFDVASLAPPNVPDSQNLAMTPLLKPLLDYSRSETSGPVWRDTNALARVEAIDLLQSPPGADYRTNPSPGGVWMQTTVDLEKWREFYRGNTNYPQPASPGTAAADVLVALARFDAEMKELRDAAAARPLSRFPVEYDYELPAAILLRHLAPIKRSCLLLQMRATARLEVGQTQAAFEDVQLGFRLADTIKDEPILISQLVRNGMLGIQLQAIQEGLLRHAWSDQQLTEFDRQLGTVDLLAGYQLGMSGERALGIGCLEWARRQGWKFDPGMFDLQEDQMPAPEVLRFMPAGWLYRNMLTIARLHEKYTVPAIDEKSRRVSIELVKESQALEPALKASRNLFSVYANVLYPELMKSPQRVAWSQTFVDAGRVACAIERYRLANGSRPDKLDALVPKYLAKIPTDVIDGKPLRYQSKPDGTCLIYSIGWNKTDDGGAIVFSNGTDPSVKRDEGDWVWKLAK